MVRRQSPIIERRLRWQSPVPARVVKRVQAGIYVWERPLDPVTERPIGPWRLAWTLRKVA